MAGGSFGNPGGNQLNAMQQSLFSQMDSMRRTSVGVQDIFANRMMGAGPYGGGGQMAGMAGDTMFRLNQNLEKLTQNLTRSPMMTGSSALGGAGVSAGQMMAAGYFGAPVQMQGMPGGMLGSQMGRMMFAENVELGLERMERSFATQMLPGLAGAAASLAPGGAVLGPMVGAAAQAYAPMGLRALGVDASLNRGQMARQFRMDIGDRIAGGSVAGRFAESTRIGRDLAGGMVDYINTQQAQYSAGGGMLNFGLSAEEYAPLQSAMTATMSGGELERFTKGGSKAIKEQMDALIGVSATLNMTFKETADLARQFGEVEGGTGALATYVQTIEDASQRAGIGMRRGMAAQFGLAMRGQARAMGLQGELSAGMAIQDVGVLQGLMNQTAGQRMLTHDQLASFGGASEQERIQNMVQSMFTAGANIAQGPVGAMIRGNILAGNAGMQGGMLGMMGTAGGQFARDPFGFMISQADPRVNQQVQTRALFTHMGMLEEAFGGLDPQAASAAFIAKAGSLGLSKTQAGSLQRFYQTQKQAAQKIASESGVKGATSARVMAAANAMADQFGITPSEAMARMGAEGGLTLAEAEGMAAGTFGYGATGGTGMTDSAIEAAVNQAGDVAAETATNQLYAKQNEALQAAGEISRDGGDDWSDWLGNKLRGGVQGWSALYGGTKTMLGLSPEVQQARTAAMASKRAELMRARTLTMTSQEGAIFARQHASLMRRAGVDVTASGELGEDAFAKFSLAGFGRGSAIGDVVRGLATGDGDLGRALEALKGTDETGFKTLLTTIGALSHSEAWEKNKPDASEGIQKILKDNIVDMNEASGPHFSALVEFMQSTMGKSTASALAFNSLRPMINDANAMQSLMQTNNDLLSTIANNTKKEK